MPAVSYDAIVIGAGGVGSAAMWRLARRGWRVLGVDRFQPPHDRGSSHGQTRIIRQAYFEHADYVPLLLESYRLWEELEQSVARRLKVECGLVEIGPPDGEVVPGVLSAAAQHGLAVEQLDAAAIEHRWPAFRVPDGMVGVYERRAGFLHVEACVQACRDAAAQAGAELLDDVEVHNWVCGDDIVVQTTVGDFRCRRLLVAAGAWAGEMLQSLGVPLVVRRKPVLWYAGDDHTSLTVGFPCFLFELAAGVFYGFPTIDRRGLKAAEHSGGDVIADPGAVDRTLHDTDRHAVERFLRQCIPSAATTPIDHAVCMYTMSPDQHFIVDRHPADPRIVFAAGLSGHGFKFTPVLGEALAQLAVDGTSDLPVEFLSMARF